MINTKRPNTDDYTQVGFIEAKDTQGNYQNIDHIYDSEGNIVFQQGYLNEYDGADDFRIPAIGKPLIDYTIYGNTFQDGIPTPDNPIMPEGTGERTGNLSVPLTEWEDGYLNSNGNIADANPTRLEKASGYIEITNKETLAFSYPNGFPSPSQGDGWRAMCFYTADKTHITRTDPSENYGKTPLVVNIPANAKYVRLSFRTFGQTDNAMLNSGSTPLLYEPYGYKIPISSGGQTTPVYLGEVQTTRKIGKLVLTGEESNWQLYQQSSQFWHYEVYQFWLDNIIDSIANSSLYSTIVPFGATAQSRQNYEYGCYTVSSGKGIAFQMTGAKDTFVNITAWKTYLQQQYASGTPVTVWYVLATPETAVVNEPLMKIGDYADTLSMEQAGVQIPTLKRPNITEIDITTSLPPSEVYAKYRGSKTQKYDLFLAANGDSFEAKNGQSLYIGDDT